MHQAIPLSARSVRDKRGPDADAGQIAELIGILQGDGYRVYGGKRPPQASTTFEAFAKGLGVPPVEFRANASLSAGSGGQRCGDDVVDVRIR